uniref:Uncharacterized protein n=1 Tax=Panagrolaimus davidi TaxID=227884 RepID=A0A914PJZ1_9BILA
MLLQNFKQDKIQSIKLSKEKWDSVFWDNIFTRPDVQTSFLDQTMKFDKKKKEFKMDTKKAEAFMKKLANKHSNGHDDSINVGAMVEGFGIDVGKSHGETESNADASEDAEKNIDTFSYEKLVDALKKSGSKTKWDGHKFVQKNVDLFRVNTKNLQSAAEMAFNRVIVKTSEKSTNKIEIRREKNESSEWIDLYEETLPTLPTTTTTTTTPIPTTKRKVTHRKTTTTTTTTTTTPKPHCSFPVDEDLYHTLVSKGIEPCSYIQNQMHPTPKPTRPPPPTKPPPPPPHQTNAGDVINHVIDKLCFFCG